MFSSRKPAVAPDDISAARRLARSAATSLVVRFSLEPVAPTPTTLARTTLDQGSNRHGQNRAKALGNGGFLRTRHQRGRQPYRVPPQLNSPKVGGEHSGKSETPRLAAPVICARCPRRERA